jgi:purine-binding chemotaxis protein CheW
MTETSDFFLNNTEELKTQIQELQTLEGELHLRFYVPSYEEFALPATGVREVMQHNPKELTPIPNTSPLLLGTINLRGQIIWVADLGEFLGSNTPLNISKPEISIIAIEDEETILGLAIECLSEMQWLDIQQLQISTDIPDQIAPYVQGEWIISKEPKKVIRLLDHQAILRSARWAA